MKAVHENVRREKLALSLCIEPLSLEAHRPSHRLSRLHCEREIQKAQHHKYWMGAQLLSLLGVGAVKDVSMSTSAQDDTPPPPLPSPFS